MKEERLRHLFYLYAQKKASEKEEEEFNLLVADPSNTGFLQQLVDSYIIQREEEARIGSEDASDILKAIFHAGKQSDSISLERIRSRVNRPSRRIHVLKTRWFRYAAAIILLFGTGYYLLTIKQEKPQVTIANPVPLKNDVLPGGNKAVLTLADGRRIVLDSTSNGQVTEENGSIVLKKSDGQLEYRHIHGETQDANMEVYNTLSTPNGGQYQLVLQDGTKVWLNAASSITYPTSFTEKSRQVSIKGEVYLEVAKEKKRPFRVSASNLTVEVLGTHFNINAYDDEAFVRTTLLEGSIKMSSSSQTSLLIPGQQAQCKEQSINVIKNLDMEQVMAWKNGVFNFNRLPLADVMRQLARWYDLRIEYDDNLPTINFYGDIGRDLTLNQMLKVLSGLGVKFTIKEGKRLIVSPG